MIGDGDGEGRWIRRCLYRFLEVLTEGNQVTAISGIEWLTGNHGDIGVVRPLGVPASAVLQD